MPEFFGDAAVYYRNGNGASLADRLIVTLALDDQAKSAQREKAGNRAELYTWERCAFRTVEELLKA